MTQEPDQYYKASLVNNLPTVTFPPKPYHRRITNIVIGNSVASAVTVYRGLLGSVPVAQNRQGQNNTLSGSITLPAGQVLFVQWDTVGVNVTDAFARASFVRDDSPLGDSSIVDTQQWSTSTISELIVGDLVNGEVVITQGITAALQAFYSPVGTISSVTIRMMPSDGSYFYIIAGFNPVSGNDFVAMGNAKPNAVLATDIAQQWFSFFNASSGISQINLGDLSHDQRVLVNSNFTQFGGTGLRGDVDVDGVLQNFSRMDFLQANFATVRIANSADIFMGPGAAAGVFDVQFGRNAPGKLYADPIYALNAARNNIDNWNALGLNAPWANRGAGFPAMSYRLVAAPAKSLQLCGQLTVGGAVSGSVIGTLPVNYRPTTAIGFSAGNDGNASDVLIEVETTGDVKAFCGAFGAHIQINGVIPLDL